MNTKTHWLIQHHTNLPLDQRVNEYISVHEQLPFGLSKLEQVWLFCITRHYDVANIKVIETSTKHIHTPLVQLMIRNLK